MTRVMSFDSARRRAVKARYDVAQTTPDNARYWAWADALSADAAMLPDVRKTLRDRSRYEAANNSYAAGTIDTLAGDAIGTGPRLQVTGLDVTDAQEVERAFSEWSDSIGLAEKLNVMRRAKITDGETFAILTANPRLYGPIRLDIVVVEADRVCSPNYTMDASDIDGVEIDALGYPVRYQFLKSHPGGVCPGVFTKSDYYTLPAERVIHWFKKYRPEQHRGIPELVPALSLFAKLRRFTDAVTASAETAADFAVLLKSDAPASVTDDDDYGASQIDLPQPLIDEVPIEKRTGTVLPAGWDATQMRAEQPCSTYAEFKRELLAEIGRCLCVPVNVITGDSSKHNYASGRLDHQVYHRAIRLEQKSCERTVLAPLIRAWLAEYNLQARMAGRLEVPAEARLAWYWDGFEHVDPQKVANAQQTLLACGLTSMTRELAKQGVDIEEHLATLAYEKKLKEQYGLSFPAESGGVQTANDTTEGDSDEQRQ